MWPATYKAWAAVAGKRDPRDGRLEKVTEELSPTGVLTHGDAAYRLRRDNAQGLIARPVSLWQLHMESAGDGMP